MSKREIKAAEEERYSFPKIKAYSIDEVLAAGGADAFAEKLGKNFQNIEHRLKKLPKEAFLTDEEVTDALKMLNESK